MGCLTLLTEVTGKAVVQVLVEISTMSPLQSCAEPKVGELHVTLEPKTPFHQALVIKHRHIKPVLLHAPRLILRI